MRTQVFLKARTSKERTSPGVERKQDGHSRRDSAQKINFNKEPK